METDKNSRLKTMTPEEYQQKANEFYVAGDIDGFLEFQRTHSILYVDPIPEESKKLLEKLDIPELPEDFELGLM